MADDLDELVLKVGVQVDAEQLKKLREEIKKMQDEAAKTAAGLGIKAGSSSSSGGSPGTGSFSNEILNVLRKSNDDLKSIVSLLKKQAKDKPPKIPKLTTEEKKEKLDKKKGFAPFVQDISKMNKTQIVGGGVGGGIGAMLGNAGLGAEIGSAVLGATVGVFDMLKSTFEGVTAVFQKRLEEDIHFDKLSMATGKTREELALLSEQARLSAYSLDALVQSNLNFADEMITGISPQKAQIMMALGINPNALNFQAGGDPAKVKQMMFEQILEKMKGQPVAKISQIMRLEGFNIDEQYARSMMNDKDVKDRAHGIVNKATLNGTQPFLAHKKLREQNLSFTGYAAELAASKRAAATTKVAEEMAMKTMEVKAGIMNVVAKGAVNISTLGQTIEDLFTPKTKSDAQQTLYGEGHAPFWSPNNSKSSAVKGSAP